MFEFTLMLDVSNNTRIRMKYVDIDEARWAPLIKTESRMRYVNVPHPPGSRLQPSSAVRAGQLSVVTFELMIGADTHRNLTAPGHPANRSL